MSGRWEGGRRGGGDYSVTVVNGVEDPNEARALVVKPLGSRYWIKFLSLFTIQVW